MGPPYDADRMAFLSLHALCRAREVVRLYSRQDGDEARHIYTIRKGDRAYGLAGRCTLLAHSFCCICSVCTFSDVFRFLSVYILFRNEDGDTTASTCTCSVFSVTYNFYTTRSLVRHPIRSISYYLIIPKWFVSIPKNYLCSCSFSRLSTAKPVSQPLILISPSHLTR